MARSGPTTLLLLLLPSLRLSDSAQLYPDRAVYDCTTIKCLALVIGNSKYRPAHADPKALTSPFHDAVDMAKLLRVSGATVTEKHDLTKAQMQEETMRLMKQLRDARKDSGGTQGAIGIFYYSGHGVGSDGETYLLPVDLGSLLVGEDQTKKNTQQYAVTVSSIAAQMESANTAQNIIILDSCRTRLEGDPPVKGSAGGHPSYAKSENKPPSGTIIAYATKAGNVALPNTGDRKHSVYTHHFLEAAKASDGLPIETLLRKVASFVSKETRQFVHMKPDLVIGEGEEHSDASFALIPSSSSHERPSFNTNERPESGHDKPASTLTVSSWLKIGLVCLVIFAAGAGTGAFTGRDDKKMSTPDQAKKPSGLKALSDNQKIVYYEAAAAAAAAGCSPAAGYNQALKKAQAAPRDLPVQLTAQDLKELKQMARRPRIKGLASSPEPRILEVD